MFTFLYLFRYDFYIPHSFVFIPAKIIHGAYPKEKQKLFLLFAWKKENNTGKLGMTWGWVIEYIIFIYVRTDPLNKAYLCYPEDTFPLKTFTVIKTSV